MLKDEIIELMGSKRYIPAELTDFVKYFSNYERDEVICAIDELKKEYEIMESNKGKLILAKTKGYFKGVVTGVFDDHIFVKIDKYDKDLKVAKKRHDIVLPKDGCGNISVNKSDAVIRGVIGELRANVSDEIA